MPISDKAGLAPRLGAEIEQRHAVAEPVGLDGDLDDFGAGRSHRLHEPGKIGRHALEIVVRQHHAAAARVRHEIVEARARFDVDVLRAERQRVGENAPSIFFRALEVTAFPLRAARDDDRTAAAGQRAGDVRDRSPSRDAARPDRRRRRRRGGGGARPSSALSRSHRAAVSASVVRLKPVRRTSDIKKASSPVRLKRLGNSRSRGGRSGQGDCPFSRAPIPPPGGRRPNGDRRRSRQSQGKPTEGQALDQPQSPERYQRWLGGVNHEWPFLLDQQALLPNNGRRTHADPPASHCAPADADRAGRARRSPRSSAPAAAEHAGPDARR